MAYVFTSILGTPTRGEKMLVQVFQDEVKQNKFTSSRACLSFELQLHCLGLHCPNLCLKDAAVTTSGREVRDGIVLTGSEWEACGYFKLLISQYLMSDYTCIYLCKQEIFVSRTTQPLPVCSQVSCPPFS